MIQSMLADTPLVKNLDNNKYMKILLDGKNNLEELFADLKMGETEKLSVSPVEVDCVLPGFRELITQPNLPEQIDNFLLQANFSAKSN